MNDRFVVKTSIACLVALAMLPSAIRADQIVVTNRGEWESLVGGAYTEETFFDNVLNPGLSFDSDVGFVNLSDHQWHDSIAVDGPIHRETRFFFDQPVTAFGANWDFMIGGSGVHILLDDTELVSPRVPNSFDGGFYGFVSDAAFHSVTFLSKLPGQGYDLETYTMDNMVYSANYAQPIEQTAPITMQTHQHALESTLKVDFFIGDPNAGGQQVLTTGPASLQGSLDVVVDLDELGNGYIQVRGGDLDFADFGPAPVDLGPLGTINGSILDTHLVIESFRMDVVNYQFMTDGSAPIILEINGGTASFGDPTGILANLFPDGFAIDFQVNPKVATTTAEPIAASGILNPDGTELNLVIPEFSVLIQSLIPGFDVYTRFSADIHVATAVPELSSSMLAGFVAIAAVGVRLRKRFLA